MLQELSIPTRYEDDRGDDSDVAARYLVITFHCNITFHFVYSTIPDASKSRSFQQSSSQPILFTPFHLSSLYITSLNIEMDEETEYAEYAHTAYSTSSPLWNHSIHTPFHFNHRQKTPREGSAQYTRYTRSPHLSHSLHVIERRIHSSIVLMERDCGIRL